MSRARTSPRSAGIRLTTATRLGERLGDRGNNFDLLRLLAAWAVLVSHSFALVGRKEPLHQLDTSLGALGVLVFFGVSGLLIRRSWELDPSPRDFWIKRALRLLPALAAVAVVTAFVLGPLVTNRSLGAYFSSGETWIYPVRVVGMVPFGAGLPGVFEGGLYAGAVNGPLWSLPVEVFAYALLAAFGVLGLLRNRVTVLAVSIAGLGWAAVWVTITSPSIGAVHVLAAFAVGAAAYSYRDRIVLSWWGAAIAVASCVISGLGPAPLRVVVWCIAVPYLCYWFALALPPIGRSLTRFGDASYGLYIWAFPVQQLVVSWLGHDIAPWLVIGMSTPVVWLLAQASWHLVERRALRHKPRPSMV